MKTKLTLILCLLIKISSYSQNKISGKLTDELNEPLPFANIILYQSKGNNVLTGTTSDENGFYSFENVIDGTYWLEVSVLGFETKKSDAFVLSEERKAIELNFLLKEETQTLNEVVIKSTRPVIRQTAEKLIVNLEKSQMVSSNLQDVMKKVPGIIVTNGGISYGGQQGVRILINGKTTDYMDTASLLRDFPADNIARVELVQQPGAEFDAEGTGPLLNIILKKNVRLGTHGNIKAYQGYDNQYEYATSFSLASYKNRLNWQISAGYSQITNREDLFIKRIVNDETYDQASISPYDPQNLRFSGTLDYYINEEHSFGLSTRRIYTDSDRITSNSTQIIQNNISNELFTENNFDKERSIFNINPYYEFSNEKNKIILDFDYVDYDDDNLNDLLQVGQSTINYNDQRYSQNAKYQILTSKLDYKRTVNENFNWMFGIKYSEIDTDNNLNSFTKNNQGVFEQNFNQSNRFFIDEKILASYIKFTSNLKRWMFSGGVRWEESTTKGTSTNPVETRTRNISKLFPSASISRKLTEKLGTNFSYSYRIRRPSYSSLNSFVYYYDPYTFEEGNPNLKPAFTNSFQFNLTFDDQPFFSVGYKDTSDALFELITQIDNTAETSRSVINLSERKNWNFRAFAPLNFIENLEGYSGIIVNHNSFKSKNLSPNLDLSKWSLTWYTNIEYKLPWNIHSELTGYYTSGGLQGQIEHDWLAGLSFAMSKKFMEDRLKINIGIGEILNRQFIGVIRYDNINADVISDWSRQNVYFQLTYNFGSKFNKKKKKNKISKEEEERIKDNN
jgi:hypothetical protein